MTEPKAPELEGEYKKRSDWINLYGFMSVAALAFVVVFAAILIAYKEFIAGVLTGLAAVPLLSIILLLSAVATSLNEMSARQAQQAKLAAESVPSRETL